VHDWGDLQRIKNAILGPSCEAVELYPACDRLVDGVDYHLWSAGEPTWRFPLGFAGGDDAVGWFSLAALKSRGFP
jgi:hypothetical protein